MSVSLDSLASGRRAVNRKNNRDAILDAARDVFAEIGYGGTTVRDIIRRTNLASGTFYNYFDSKEAVFNALSDEIGTELRQLLRDVRQRATSFDGFIEAMFLTYFSYYAKNRENYMLTRSNRGRDGMNEVMQGPQVRAGLAELSDDIRQAIAEGVIPQLDVEFLTASLGGVAFSILDEMMEREPLDPEAAAQFATRLFMTGVRGNGS
ncbi:MAG: TetR/AcrR family transcriptional regulator [Pseudomonadota bacterium]|nr:TetR/AcrR family transcriptional regulator [Pseudomonadota bacterium]